MPLLVCLKKGLQCWRKRETFGLELAAVLGLKVLFLTALWFFCFRHGLQDHLSDELMTAHWIGR
jgi:hypothetical protein